MRIVLLVGTAVLMLWSSPTTAQPGLPTRPMIPLSQAAISNVTFLLQNDTANGAVFGGVETGAGGFGVVGLASATSSANFGVAGATNSDTGTGVFGLAFATTCPNAVLPLSLGQTCAGVVGQSLAASGTSAGVAGLTQSSNGAGVFGQATSGGGVGVNGVATATSGQNFGVVGLTNSAGDATTGSSAFGVFGRATDTTAPSGSQLTIGTGGRSDSPGGVGVFGRAAATSGQNFGVFGRTDSAGDATTQSFAFGVFGRATALSGFTVGVQGRVDGTGDLTTQTPAIGARGVATNGSGFTIGVRGDTFSTGDFASGLPSIGVDGRARAASGFTIGVRGRITDINGNPGGSPNGTGVVGDVTTPSCPTVTFPVSLGQTCVGVFGRSFATSGSTAGVVGTSQSSSPSAGVLGQTTSSGVAGAAPAGVFGVSTATSGFTAGVVGQTNSPNGAAIVGSAANGGLAGLFTCTGSASSCLVVNGTGVTVPDLAEDMPVAHPVSPGDVVVLTRGQSYGIAPAARAYDTLVAGIVSTAPRVRFGIGQGKAVPVAMVGVVKAKATAVNGAIKFGDLLTTSPVAGHLMRCEAAVRCVGAIVGKALEPLPKGEQSILVLLWRQ